MTYLRQRLCTKHKKGAMKWIALMLAILLVTGTFGSFTAQATDVSEQPDTFNSIDLTITGSGNVSVTDDVYGKGTGEGIYQFETGSYITLAPVPDEGAGFSHWEGVASEKEKDSPLIVELQDDLVLTAHFITLDTVNEEATPTYDVTTSVTPGDAGAIITGEGSYEEGAEVGLEAVAGENYEFDKWTADSETVEFEDSGSNETTFTMPEEDVAITANFVEKEEHLEIMSMETPEASINFAGGDGSKNNPYQIETVEQLQAMKNNLSAHYELISNIDASETTNWNDDNGTAKGFEPIGLCDGERSEGDAPWKQCENEVSFTGSFDGQNYEISNLTINRPGTIAVGLFGSAHGAKFSNLRLSEVDIRGDENTAGLVGQLIGGDVTDSTEGVVANVSVQGTIEGGLNTAGIVGHGNRVNLNSQLIFEGQVTGSDEVGGIIGRASEDTEVSTSYVNATVKALGEAQGRVYGDAVTAGGLVGNSGNPSHFSDVYVAGNVTSECSNGNNVKYAGAIVGAGSADTYENVYWDIDKGPNVAAGSYNDPSGVEGLSTIQMQGASAKDNMPNFDWENTWRVVSGNYPVFQWQVEAADTVEISGKVTDSLDGSELEGITVTSDRDSATTDQNGEYTLSVSVITDTVNAMAVVGEGFSIMGERSVAGSDENTIVNLSLAPSYEGDGTKESPFKVRDLEDLQQMRYNLNAHYELQGNVDASDTENWFDGKGFEPIGTYDEPFTGTFDGQSNKIEDLYINRPEQNFVALFGAAVGTDNSKHFIENLRLVNVNITGKAGTDRWVGKEGGGVAGLVGGINGKDSPEDATIVNVSVEGVITAADGNFNAAGLVAGAVDFTSLAAYSKTPGFNLEGRNTFKGTIDAAGVDQVGGMVSRAGWSSSLSTGYVIADIIGKDNVGGIVGHSSGSTSTFSDMYFAGTVTGNNDALGVGAIVGTVGSSGDDFQSSVYWDKSLQPNGHGVNTVGGTVNMQGLLTEEMQGENARINMNELDFDTTWHVVSGDYPVFDWEAVADERAAISGTIYNDDGTVFEGATVNLYAGDDLTVDSIDHVTTDVDGTYEFSGLVAKETLYTVEVIVEGYSDDSHEVTLEPGIDATGVNFTLEAREYTITFETGEGSDVAAITQDYGTDIPAPDEPTREGYTFEGWDPELPETMPSEDLELTARWEYAGVLGEFRVANYGTGLLENYRWYRGYVFQVTEETNVTALIGGGTEGVFAGGIYSIEVDGSGEIVWDVTPTELLGSVNFTGTTPEQVVTLSEKITLVPDTYYLIASGKISGGSDGGFGYAIESIDVDDLESSSSRIKQGTWRPPTGGAIQFTILDIEPEELVNKTSESSFSEFLPMLGFQYKTDIQLPTVITEVPEITSDSVTLKGELTDTGGAETSLYFEWGTEENLSVSGNFISITSTLTHPTSYKHLLDEIDAPTYYYRAVAINEAGRVEGEVITFHSLYNISYNLDGGINYDGAPENYTIVTDTINLGTPTKSGYIFKGWFDAETGGNKITQIEQDTTGDIILWAQWEPNTDTPYKVEHYRQNVTGDGYTRFETDTLEGTTDTTAYAIAKTYTGFSENTVHADRVESGNIEADESLTLKLYYDRETFTVDFKDHNDDPLKSETVRYEGTAAAPADPTRIGYTFESWEGNYTNVTQNETVVAKYTANTDTAYKVEHYQQNVTGDGYTLYELDNTLTGTTDTQVTAVVKAYTGFSENTSHAGSVPTGNIAGDGSLVLKLYYDRVQYTVTFKNHDGTEFITDHILYENPVSAPDNPTRSGYLFRGWYEDEALAVVFDFETLIVEDIDLYSRWRRRSIVENHDLSSNDDVTDSDELEENTIVFVNGQEVKAGKESVNEESGEKDVEVTLDSDVISTMIEEVMKTQSQESEEEQFANMIEVLISTQDAEKITVTLTGDIVKKMDEGNFSLSITSEDINYVIPATEIGIENAANDLGVPIDNLREIEIEIKIIKIGEEATRKIVEKAKANGYEILFPPVSFEVVAKTMMAGEEKQVPVSKFNQYVQHTLKIPEGVDPGQITGIVYNEDGIFSHVPTIVFMKDGVHYATINSLTNSIYSVIWNPVTVESVKNHWSEEVVNDMASRLVIQNPEMFMPDQNITRGEFAELITKALGIHRTGVAEAKKFTDVEVTHELADAIEIATGYGIISGYPDSSFKPDAQISREEAMVMYSKAMDITGLEEIDNNRIENYKDKNKIADWAYNHVKKTVSTGVFKGKTNETINPEDTFTYAEAAAAIRKLLAASGLINE